MRDYAKVAPSFWTGKTGRAIRGLGPEAQVVAIYLMTCPSANMIGLYYLPVPTLCHETGIPSEGASKALRSLSRVGFAHYDEETETVWVPEMAKYQVGDALKPNDNRTKGVLKELETYEKSPFFHDFIERYWDAFSIPGAKPLRRPSEAPSKPLRSQEQEQEQEQEEQTMSASADRVADPSPKPAEQPPLLSVQALPDPVEATADRVFAYWRERMGKRANAVFSPERRKAVEKRLRDGYSEADLRRAIDGCKASPHHQGQNDRGAVYDDLELICRDAKHVDAFIEFSQRRPTASASSAKGFAGYDPTQQYPTELPPEDMSHG